MVERYYKIYSFSPTLIGRIIRFGPAPLAALMFAISATPTNEGFLNAVASFGILIINEIFLSVKVSTTQPEFTVEKESEDVKKMVFGARRAFSNHDDATQIVKSLLGKSEVKFFISKMGGVDIKDAKVDKKELLTQAKELVKYVKGKYITELDLFASYLLLSEDETKILSDKEMINEDVINILYWTRKRFEVDTFSKRKLQFIGTGVFDSLVYGWDYEIKKYTRDLTSDVFNSHFPPKITGHEKEYQELLVALSKGSNTNAILTGEVGVGKTSMVEFLAYQSFAGEVPKHLFHKRVYELYVDKILAGVNSTGELEERIGLLISDILHSGQAIIFIRNIENIFGGGGFGFDMSGVLNEYLKGDAIRIIGTTSPASYDKYIQPKESLHDLVDVIRVEEFDTSKSLLLLSEMAEKFETFHKVQILYPALKQSVLLAPVYFPDRFYPGSAVALLDEVISSGKMSNKKIIDADMVIALVEGKTHVALATPDRDEKELLLKLEEKMHGRVIGQEEAVKAVADAMRRVRSGFANGKRPIASFLFLGPTGVGKTETAKVLAKEYFGNEEKMIRIDMSELQNQGFIDKIIGSSGGEYTANSLAEKIRENPFSLVLLDEFEKADREILNIFLQIFDEGHVTDARGVSVSFKNSIIIATSNAGSELIRENSHVTKDQLVDTLLKNNLFSPELLNRFDEIVMFNTLTQDNVKKIAAILLAESAKKLTEEQIEISFDDSIVSRVAEESFDVEFGARNIRRYITDNIEQFVSKLILEDKVKRGDKIVLSVDESGNLSLK